MSTCSKVREVMPFFDTQHKTCIPWGPAGAYLWGRGSRRLSMEGGRHTAGRAPDRCCRNLDSSPNQRIRGILYRQCTKLKPSVGLLVTQTYQCTQTVYTFHKSYVLIRSYSVAQQRKSKIVSIVQYVWGRGKTGSRKDLPKHLASRPMGSH